MSPDARHDDKQTLLRTLANARGVLRWKLEGLSDYDARRPLTRTGTNLLGLVKHAAGVELDYFGEVFARSHGVPMPWTDDDAEDNADMWAAPDETREQILALSARAQQVTEAAVAELDLDAPGQVPWWPPERREVTLHQVLVHVIGDIARHAGHADILREELDGSAGLRDGVSNLPVHDEAWWSDYRDRLEAAALSAGPSSGSPTTGQS